MPQISVIIPVYNALGTLPRSVQSVQLQTYSDLELLLVDDGSRDGSSALCDQLAAADPRIRVIHQDNGGVSAARNAGLDAALGQWVLFLDADDALAPAAAETALTAAQQQPGRIILWPCTGSLDGLCSTPAPAGQPLAFDQLAKLQLQNLLPMPWNKLYRRDVIEQHRLRFDTGYSLGEDLLFCLDYCAAFLAEGNAGFWLLDTPLTYYEQGLADSLTHRLRPDYFDLWKGLYSHLFEVCTAVFACPQQDVAALRCAALQTISFGADDFLQRGEGTPAQRSRQVKQTLRHPWLKEQRRLIRRAGQFSLFSPGITLASPALVQWAVHLRTADEGRFYHLQYTGLAIRRRLHPARRQSSAADTGLS